MFSEMFFIDNNGNFLRKSHIPIQTYTVFLFHSFLFTFYGLIPLSSHIHKRLATHNGIPLKYGYRFSDQPPANRMDGDINLICEKKKRLFGIQNKYICSFYSGTHKPGGGPSVISILIWWMQFLSAHIYSLAFSKPFQTQYCYLFVYEWEISSHNSMKEVRMCLAVVVRGIQWLEEKKINGR